MATLGVILVVVGAALMVAEADLPSHGVLGERASAELHSLMYGDDKMWFLAYAMGAGCATEDNGEISVAIRRRVPELRAVIAEHREAS